MSKPTFEMADHEGVAVLTVLRDLDHAAADAVQNALGDLIKGGRRSIVCNLEPVKLIDSSGMKALACAQISARKSGAAFALVCTDSNLSRLFEVTGLSEFIPLRPTLAAAIAHVTPAA